MDGEILLTKKERPTVPYCRTLTCALKAPQAEAETLFSERFYTTVPLPLHTKAHGRDNKPRRATRLPCICVRKGSYTRDNSRSKLVEIDRNASSPRIHHTALHIREPILNYSPDRNIMPFRERGCTVSFKINSPRF